MTTLSSWFAPTLGFVLGVLVVLSLRALESRSGVARLVSSLPRDERWMSINLRAQSLAAQVLAIVLIGAFLLTQFNGGDADAYARLGAILAAAYLGGLVWYRSRS
jgi:hypothetical protein